MRTRPVLPDAVVHPPADPTSSYSCRISLLRSTALPGALINECQDTSTRTTPTHQHTRSIEELLAWTTDPQAAYDKSLAESKLSVRNSRICDYLERDYTF